MTTDKKARKEMPIVSGVLDYFPDALAAVARVSYVGNEQHNPGQPLHWARDKSKDHTDCLIRHFLERGKIDDDGLSHTAKMVWRGLAMLQLETEASREAWASAPITGEQFGTLRPTDPHSAPRKMRVYIAGPMRGIKDFNFQAFDAARDALKKKGYDPVSPADMDRADPFQEKDQAQPARVYARRDLSAILDCDAICLLPGWATSVGASAEFMVARWLGLTVMHLGDGEIYLATIQRAQLILGRTLSEWSIQ